MQEGQLVEKPFERKPLRFRFPELERSGRTVFEIKNLGVRYDDKVRVLCNSCHPFLSSGVSPVIRVNLLTGVGKDSTVKLGRMFMRSCSILVAGKTKLHLSP